jgi:hypothetical protein
MSLLAWLSVACTSLVLWPIHAFFRRIRSLARGNTVEAAAQEEVEGNYERDFDN